MSQSVAVPFTILTGYLGAGKTTALNRLLRNPLGRRIAVLVNELGRVPIDGRLINQAGGDVLELAGGCVCCKIDVKNDLWDGIADVVERSAPDHVVLETTGIAEPPALIEGLSRLPESLAERIAPAGVVCVVDAETCAAVLDQREEARIQVACADRLLLSKLDRAGPDEVATAHRLLVQLAPAAERASFPASIDGDRALSAFLLARRTPAAPAGEAAPHRHGQLACACFSDAVPLLPGPLMAAVEELRGQLVRVKGFVHLAGDERRAFLELAGTALALRPGPPWAPGEPRRSELVFIGDDLDDDLLARRLWACAAREATA
jgi:G3E family GTPase